MKENDFFSDEVNNWHSKGYFKLIKTQGKIDIQLKKALKPFSITHAQLSILNALVRNHPKPMDAKTIKNKLIVQSPDLTRLVDRLVKKGLVDRKTSSESRRKIDITITDNGIKLFYQAHQSAKQFVNNYFKSDITKEEAKELFRILNKIKI